MRVVLIVLLVLASPISGCIAKEAPNPKVDPGGGRVELDLGDTLLSDPAAAFRLGAALAALDPSEWTRPTALVLTVRDGTGDLVLTQEVAVGDEAAHVQFVPGPAAFDGLGHGYEIRLAGGVISQNASGVVAVTRDASPEAPAEDLAHLLGRSGGLALLGTGIDPILNLTRLNVQPCNDADCLTFRSLKPAYFGVVRAMSEGRAWFNEGRLERIENVVNLSAPSPVPVLVIDLRVAEGVHDLPTPHEGPRLPLAVPVDVARSPGDLRVTVAESSWMDGRLEDFTLVVLEDDRDVLALPLANGSATLDGEVGSIAFADAGSTALFGAGDALTFSTSASAHPAERHVAVRDAWAGGAFVRWRLPDGTEVDRLVVS